MKFREKSLIINKLLLAGQYVLNLVDIGSDLYIYIIPIYVSPDLRSNCCRRHIFHPLCLLRHLLKVMQIESDLDIDCI